MKNYHTHTTRCKHAINSEEEYIIQAISSGYSELGFSDHTPWHYESGFISPMRMHENELEEYVHTLTLLKEKYKKQISIKVGLEAEYFKEKIPWLTKQIKKYSIDYCILGQHFHLSDDTNVFFGNPWSKEDLVHYVNDCIDGMKTGLFSYLAHPDLPNFDTTDPYYIEQMRRICVVAKEVDIPLEFNLEGYIQKRHFPNSIFLSLVKEVGNKVIIGVDSHSAKSLDNRETYLYVKSMLEKNDICVTENILFFKKRI